MNVTDMLKSIHGNEIYFITCRENRDEVERIEAAYQEAWDSGKGFTFTTMFRGRKEDSEEEKAACAGQMMNALKEIVVEGWLSQYSRDEIAALCGLLCKGPKNCYTRVCLASDLEIDLDDISGKWNKLHPDDAPFYLPGPDIG